jgi:hypothetical protein
MQSVHSINKRTFTCRKFTDHPNGPMASLKSIVGQMAAPYRMGTGTDSHGTKRHSTSVTP